MDVNVSGPDGLTIVRVKTWQLSISLLSADAELVDNKSVDSLVSEKTV